MGKNFCENKCYKRNSDLNNLFLNLQGKNPSKKFS